MSANPKGTATLSWLVSRNHRHYAGLEGYAFLNPDFTPVNYSSSRMAPVIFVQMASAKSDRWTWASRLAQLRTSGCVHNYTFPNVTHVIVIHNANHTEAYPIAYMFESTPTRYEDYNNFEGGGAPKTTPVSP